jgi:hypothetical protein
MKVGTQQAAGSRQMARKLRLLPPASCRLPAVSCLLLTAFSLLPGAMAEAQSRILSLQPNSGSTRGGSVVTIEVEGGVVFGPMQVRFGERPATGVRRAGLSTLEVLTPPGEPGPVGVRVVNDLWGATTQPVIFTYIPPAPRLTRLVPAAASVGSEGIVLSIEGEHFSRTSGLRFGEASLPATFVTPRRMEARIPSSLLDRAGLVAVTVHDGALGGGKSNAITFTVANPPPEVTGVDAPALKAGGPAATVTVRGRGFRPDSVVQIAGTPVATQYRAAEELAGAIPAELLAKPGSLAVAVVTPGPGGGGSNSLAITVRPQLRGRFVAFTSNRRGGRNHVYLLDRETGRLDPLEEANSTNGSDGYPSISGDGRFIVFQSDRHRGQYDVFLFDREARRLDPLTELNHPTAFDGFPHISADGRFIVFESDRQSGRPKIFLFDRETRALSELREANEPAADDGLATISN